MGKHCVCVFIQEILLKKMKAVYTCSSVENSHRRTLSIPLVSVMRKSSFKIKQSPVKWVSWKQAAARFLTCWEIHQLHKPVDASAIC